MSIAPQYQMGPYVEPQEKLQLFFCFETTFEAAVWRKTEFLKAGSKQRLSLHAAVYH